MFEQFEPFVRGCILEVGAGIGTFSELLLTRPVSDVVLMEPHGPCVEVLRREFSDRPECADHRRGSAGRSQPCRGAGHLRFRPLSDVLEHIEDDVGALEAMARMLCPGGRLGSWSRPILASTEIDEAYDHFRRYTRPVVRSRLEACRVRRLTISIPSTRWGFRVVGAEPPRSRRVEPTFAGRIRVAAAGLEATGDALASALGSECDRAGPASPAEASRLKMRMVAAVAASGRWPEQSRSELGQLLMKVRVRVGINRSQR